MEEKMKNKQPSFIDLLIEAHINLNRQGPGSKEATKQALKFLGQLDQFQQIADLGCGTGGQTMLLAKYLSGKVTGLDIFPVMIDKFNENAKIRNLENRVTGIVGDMNNLPFEKNTFDLIWSEGAIDNIGFEKGLSDWHVFLKKGGFVAVTCPSWLTKEHPEAAKQFWSQAGSNLDTVENNIKIMQDCGYKFISAFALPEECWIDNYFYPRSKEIEKMLKKYNKNETMEKYAKLNKQEIELYLKYKEHYGYVFYIGKVI